MQRKTTPEGVAVDRVVTVYAFLRLAMPTRPSRPEPKSHAAAGTLFCALNGSALLSISGSALPSVEVFLRPTRHPTTKEKSPGGIDFHQGFGCRSVQDPFRESALDGRVIRDCLRWRRPNTALVD